MDNTRTTKAFLHATGQRGFTLIEVLVTVIILAIGLLGLAGLQLTALKYNHSAYMRSQAIILTNDITDRMRANLDMATAGNYSIALGVVPAVVSCEGVGANCSPADVAAADLSDWKQQLAAVLPSGDGAIVQNGSLFTITLQWDDSRGEQAPVQLSVETQI